MLCTLVHEPFQNPDYIFEVKWDGYRVISYKDGDHVKLESRGGLSFSKKYPSIISALQKLPHDIVMDGEIVVLNDEGKPDFDALQKFNGAKSGVIYYAFDLLWCDGEDLMSRPLLERKEQLKKILGGNTAVRYSDHFEDGLSLFNQVQQLSLEGIVAKLKTSRYVPDKRGREWLKIPTSLKQEFVIGGWVESDSGRLFRTLLFGAYNDEGNLEWIGHAGGGYKEHEMPSILQKLKAIEIGKSPFANPVEYDGVVHWTKPELVANIKYATTTRSGKIRKPAIFLGWRNDKRAAQVIKEVPAHISDKSAVKRKATASAYRKPIRKDQSRSRAATSDSNWPIVESEKIRQRETLDFETCKVEVYNVDREIWKGITKGHLLHYYHTISDSILPYIKGRPLSLYLKLKGAFAAGVYIKDMEGREPACSEVFSVERKHKRAGKRDVVDYLVCNNVETLLYTINLGCVDVNPWTSRTAAPGNPDYIVIDLDPSDEDFSKAVVAAQGTKAVLDRLSLKAAIKTSGKTGLHIFIPCSHFTFGEARLLAEKICEQVNRIEPSITTTEVSIDQRGNKVYLDPNQNDYTDTVAAPYSVRPYKHPFVSAPIEWKELNNSLDPGKFTIDSMIKRLKKVDPFRILFDSKLIQKNNAALLKLLRHDG